MWHGRRLVGNHSIRWDEARAKSAYASKQWVQETIADAIRHEALTTPDRILLIEGDVRISAATLLDRAESLAGAMLRVASPGQVISFMLPNWHEAAIIYAAASLAGMIVHPILPSLRERELIFMLGDVNSRLLFIPATFRGFDFRAMLDRVCRQLATPPAVVVVRGEATIGTAYEALFETTRVSDWPLIDSDAVRMALYTSGTTGQPKGVLHTHNSLHALIRQIGNHWRIEPGDKFLVASPVSHIGGSIYAFECPLLLQTTAVLMERWEPAVAVSLIVDERCTHSAGATPFLEQLLVAAESAGTRLPSLKLFVCGGSSVPPSLIRRAANFFDRAVVTRVYGSTEVPVTTVGVPERNDVLHAATTDGRPGIADVKLVGGECCDQPEGEILVRGPQMLAAYLHEEDEESAFDADGYYRTGDLGRWVDDRYLVVTGRAKDIIIRNGENISPKELEDVLIDHPGIAEVSIVGVPDSRTGERVCAVIVPVAGFTLDVEAVRLFLFQQGVAIFKTPEQVLTWNALPKNDAGKALKQAIRAAILTGAGREESAT